MAEAVYVTDATATCEDFPENVWRNGVVSAGAIRDNEKNEMTILITSYLHDYMGTVYSGLKFYFYIKQLYDL